jgi:hypothetical protein
MKFKRILLLILVFIIFGAATAFANDSFEWYKGKSVKVVVNGKELSSPGLLIDGKTMLPLREIANTLQAIVNWNDNTQTVKIHKPNVHLSLVQMGRNNSFTPFGQVIHKTKYDFHIFTQVDSITTKVHSFKITIVDPKGETLYTYEDVLKEQKENIWIGTDKINLEFKELGKYTVKVFMKVDQAEDYSLVSEKTFPSIAE